MRISQATQKHNPVVPVDKLIGFRVHLVKRYLLLCTVSIACCVVVRLCWCVMFMFSMGEG